jgi:hypothetical protein
MPNIDIERNSAVYQIHPRMQANKLAVLVAQWRAARIQQHTAAPRRRAPIMRAMLAGMANLATMRVLPGGASESAARLDPRDPCNW